MKLFMYSYFNTLASFHGPIFTDHVGPEDFSKDFIQAIVSVEDKVLDTLKDDDLYFLGTFDNVSGQIIPARDFLLHISDVVVQLQAKRKEVLTDGGSEEKN